MMFKSNLVGGIVGIALMCAFLGILMWWVKAIPIVIIMVGVIALMIYDFVNSMREIKNNADNGSGV